MERNNLPAIIFDMDGTLWDSAENVAKSWNEITVTHPDIKREITTRDIQSIMGLTMDKIAESLFPDLSYEARMDVLEKCCQRENDYLRIHGGVLYEGVEETFIRLQKDYRLFIVSNCQAGYIEAFLDHYGLWKYIEDTECFGNNKKQKGENIRLICDRNNVERAVYIGDIQGDYDSSMQAGVGFIHAAYGFGTINAPVMKIDKITDLVEAAREFFTR